MVESDRSFDDVDSQRRFEQLIAKVRKHVKAAVVRRKRSEVRLLVIVDRNGLYVGDSRVDPPSEFADP